MNDPVASDPVVSDPVVSDRDMVGEANAAIGAAVSTGALDAKFRTLLSVVQYDLLDLAGGRTPSADRLRLALHRHEAELPRGFEVLGGQSPAAGLLKLAAAVTRRAARSTGSEYLKVLPGVLLAVAFHTEEVERARIPYGVC
jgi:cob(I)alamin adenosyltransferase